MGFTKFDTERGELTRERSNARIARGRDRRQARSRKHTPLPPAVAIEHDTRAATARTVPSRASAGDEPKMHAPHQVAPAPSPDTPPIMTMTSVTPVKVVEAEAVARPSELRMSRRERDIAQFRERRDQVVRQARAEAGECQRNRVRLAERNGYVFMYRS